MVYLPGTILTGAGFLPSTVFPCENDCHDSFQELKGFTNLRHLRADRATRCGRGRQKNGRRQGVYPSGN